MVLSTSRSSLPSTGISGPSNGPAGLRSVSPSGTAPTVYTVYVGSLPIWATVAYDNGWVYVPNYNSGTVSVINGTNVIGTDRVGTQPYSITYDSGNHFEYVSNRGTGNVSVLQGTQTVGSVKTGSSPEYAAYDAANGYVYVPNDGSASVTVINGTKVVATVSVGSSPYNATYDPKNGYVYVANEGVGKVSVINNTTVIASITVGNEPWSGIYDPGNGYVYVPNAGSDTVSVINNTTVLASPHVGSFPLYGGYDERNGFVYIANQDSSNVSVINGTKIVGKVTTGQYPIAAAYDPGSGDMYVPGSRYPNGTVDLIDGTTIAAHVGDGEYSQNAVYDATNGAVYVPNEDSNNVSVIIGQKPVNFVETGLPTGTSWQVNIAGGLSNASTSTNLSFLLSDGIYRYTVSSANLTYANPGGSFTVLGRAVNVSVVFSPFTYSLSFSETGLQGGTPWSVTVRGVVHSATLISPTIINVPEPNGTYPYAIGDVPGWTTLNYSGIAYVNGTGASIARAWSQTIYQVEFQETGLRSGALWWVNLSGNLSANATSSSLSIHEPNGTYTYDVATNDKTYAATGKSFTVAGAVVARTIAFSRVTFPVDFNETGLPAGTSWSVVLGGTSTPATSGSIRLGEVNGSYSYTLGGVPGWTTSSFSGSFKVLGGPVTTTIVWTQVTYSVTFTESGLPKGMHWSVTFGGTTNTSTVVVQFFGIANGTLPYTVGSVTGYDAKPASGSVVVKGGAVSQSIEFTPVVQQVPPAPAPTFLGLPVNEGYGLLGGLLVVIVAAVGVVAILARRRRAANAAAEPPIEEEATPPIEPL